MEIRKLNKIIKIKMKKRNTVSYNICIYDQKNKRNKIYSVI